VLVGERGDGVEDFDSLFLGEAVLLGDEGGDLGFGECFCHMIILFGCVVVCLFSPKKITNLRGIKNLRAVGASEKIKKIKVFSSRCPRGA